MDGERGVYDPETGEVVGRAGVPAIARQAPIAFRRRNASSAIDAVAHCPRCAATVEATFGCDDLLLTAPDEDVSAPTLEHVAHDIRVQFRLPDSSDLLALENCGDAAAARQLLLERCVLAVQRSDGAADAHILPDELQAELAQAMARADPQADLQLAFRCPDCDHAWQPMFDIARFLWQELHAWALHTLREVDTLAQAYHWAEGDILGLSPRRRQAYLELCAP